MQKFSIRIFFGHTLDKRFEKLSRALFELFELPFLEVELVKFDKWTVSKAASFSPSQTANLPTTKLSKWAVSFFTKKHLVHTLKTYDYNLAILVNPDESIPPSDKKALELFKKAGEEIGFYVEFITKKDYKRLLEFDALFIRETTDVNNHTYDFARYAYSEGIVVIDDPWSILKCSNKVFLFELMQNEGLPIPKTKIMTKNNKSIGSFQNLAFPLILKQPDSAFSKGVFKVDNYKDLMTKAKSLLKKSEMIIVQEFLESEYDWRIGVLNKKTIYACKYYMVKGDWKIISYENNVETDGEHETVAIENVPKDIIALAEKAASLIGDGLYGLDIKEYQGEYRIIEINDNPSIDHGIEDAVLGEALYRIIMEDLYRRIDLERNQIKTIR
jgi:glutathione synthase/RimK-type ligase-like ATP-grasp enzyme